MLGPLVSLPVLMGPESLSTLCLPHLTPLSPTVLVLLFWGDLGFPSKLQRLPSTPALPTKLPLEERYGGLRWQQPEGRAKSQESKSPQSTASSVGGHRAGSGVRDGTQGFTMPGRCSSPLNRYCECKLCTRQVLQLCRHGAGWQTWLCHKGYLRVQELSWWV